MHPIKIFRLCLRHVNALAGNNPQAIAFKAINNFTS